MKKVGSSKFVKDYLNLLTTVAGNYKDAAVKPKIIHVCGGSLNGFDPCKDIQTANTEFNALGNGFTGHYTTVTVKTWETINGCKKGMNNCNGNSAFNGCDGHYNGNGHKHYFYFIISNN